MTERLVIYGNCQGLDMARALRRLPCLAGRWEVNVVAWHNLHVPGSRWEDLPDFSTSRVVLWEQTGEGGSSREVLHARLPADATVLRFPPLACTALWPFEMADPRRDPDPNYPDSARYLLGDRVALDLGQDAAALRLPDDALYDLYLERCAPEVPRLERRLNFDRARAEARDRESDLAFAPFVFDNLREQQLFYDPRHVTGTMLRAAMGMLLRASANRLEVDADRACAELDTMLGGYEGQSYSQTPINPLVSAGLGLRYGDAASRTRVNGNSWTFRDYILHYLRWRPYVT